MESKKKSILNLYSEMKRSYSDKNQNDDWLIECCKSQRALAGVQRKSCSIVRMSLNTFKIYSDRYIEGGFTTIDDLRKKLNKRDKHPGIRKRKRLKEKYNLLDKQLTESIRIRAILVKAYTELNKITLDALVSSPANKYDYERHQRLYSKYFGLNMVTDDEKKTL